MEIQSREQFDFLSCTMLILFANFLDPLFELQAEKNYYTHIGSVAQIIEWSREFYMMHYEHLDDMRHADVSENNGCFSSKIEPLLLLFGRERIETFTPPTTHLSGTGAKTILF